MIKVSENSPLLVKKQLDQGKPNNWVYAQNCTLNTAVVAIVLVIISSIALYREISQLNSVSEHIYAPSSSFHIGISEHFFYVDLNNPVLQLDKNRISPRVHSGAFKLIKTTKPVYHDCFAILSVYNTFVSLQQNGNSGWWTAQSSAVREEDAVLVQLIHSSSSSEESLVTVRVCNGEQYGMSPTDHPGGLHAVPCTNGSESVCLGLELGLTGTNAGRGGEALVSVIPARRGSGVNLGGWLVPEYWMNPLFFSSRQLDPSGHLYSRTRRPGTPTPRVPWGGAMPPCATSYCTTERALPEGSM